MSPRSGVLDIVWFFLVTWLVLGTIMVLIGKVRAIILRRRALGTKDNRGVWACIIMLIGLPFLINSSLIATVAFVFLVSSWASEPRYFR